MAFGLYLTFSTLKFAPEAASRQGENFYVKLLFVLPFAFVAPFVWSDKRPANFIKVFVIAFVVYHVAFEAVMIFLRVHSGRLPALAFANLLPRYGGGWDDPNSFAAVILIGILALLLIRLPRDLFRQALIYGGLAVLMLMVLFAYSGTSALGLACIVLLLFLARRIDLRRFALLGVVGGAFILVHAQLNYLDLIYQGKVLSIEGHINTSRDLRKH